MLKRIRAFLHPQPAPDEVLADLVARVSHLEAREVAHDIAWTEAKDQISRHLKRTTEVQRRAAGQSGDLSQLVLDHKFRRNGG